MDDRTRDILERARALERISTDEALHLYDRAPLEALGETADFLRRERTDPEVVTYLIDRNVN
ncbi:MAG: dehypoxanthine futalosine cyclase, partial [Planctomycetota bacterium]